MTLLTINFQSWAFGSLTHISEMCPCFWVSLGHMWKGVIMQIGSTEFWIFRNIPSFIRCYLTTYCYWARHSGGREIGTQLPSRRAHIRATAVGRDVKPAWLVGRKTWRRWWLLNTPFKEVVLLTDSHAVRMTLMSWEQVELDASMAPRGQERNR